jgi:WD40 repeat protein
MVICDIYRSRTGLFCLKTLERACRSMVENHVAVNESDIERPKPGPREIRAFLCYRRKDGAWYADWLFRHLDQAAFRDTTDKPCNITVYYDQTAPGISDWKKLHFPSLQASQAIIVICTPGIAIDFSKSGEPDWVYEELRWWHRHRNTAPIVVDATGEGDRWLPKLITHKWPDINRIDLNKEEATAAEAKGTDFSTRICERILGAVRESEQATTFQDLQRLKRLSTRLSVALGFVAILAMTAVGIAFFAYHQRNVAEERHKTALSRQLAAQSSNHLLQQDVNLALLLGVEANRVTHTFEARRSLLSALRFAPRLKKILYDGATSSSFALAFSPDGEILAAGSCASYFPNALSIYCIKGEIRLWNLSTGKSKQVGFLPGLTGLIDTLAFTSDGKTLVFGSREDYGTVASWNINSSESTASLVLTGESASAMAFDSTGTKLAIGRYDGSVIWCEIPLGRPSCLTAQAFPENSRGIGSRVVSLDFSADGKSIAAGSYDGWIRFIEVKRKLVARNLFQAHEGAITGLSFSPTGYKLASVCPQDSLKLWNLDHANPTAQVLTNTEEFTKVVFSQDGTRLAALAENGSIGLWRLPDLQVIDQLRPVMGNYSSDIALSPNNGLLATTASLGTVTLWDSSELYPTQQTVISADHVSAVAFSQDGKVLAIAYCLAQPGIFCGAIGNRDEILLWDTVVGKPLAPPLRQVDMNIRSLAFSSDSTTLMVAHKFNHSILVWDLNTKQLKREIHLPKIPVASDDTVAFSSDGSKAAFGVCTEVNETDTTLDDIDCKVGKIEIRSLDTGDLVYPALAGQVGAVTAIAFSPDGSLLASSATDGITRIWQLSTQRVVKELGVGFRNDITGTVQSVQRLAFSPNGRILAAGGGEPGGGVILWDADSGQRIGEKLTVAPYFGSVLAFTSDGRTLVTNGKSNEVLLFDIATHESILPPLKARLMKPTNVLVDYSPNAVALSPDGRRIASILDNEKSVALWDINNDPLEARACRIAYRNLSGEEWGRYLEDEPYHKTCPNLP